MFSLFRIRSGGAVTTSSFESYLFFRDDHDPRNLQMPFVVPNVECDLKRLIGGAELVNKPVPPSSRHFRRILTTIFECFGGFRVNSMLTSAITLDLGIAKCVRIWVNSYPFLPSDEWKESIFELSTSESSLASVAEGKIAIEWFRYFGGKAEYGLLGAEYIELLRPVLRVEKRCTPDSERVNEANFSAVSGMITDANIGIPIEFCSAIDEGVREFFNGRHVPRGRLSFACGVFSEIESSSSVFMELTGAICEYFFSGRKFETEMELMTLFR